MHPAQQPAGSDDLAGSQVLLAGPTRRRAEHQREAATFTGAGGALSLALTQQAPAPTELISATFAGAAGGLSLALTQQVPAEAEVVVAPAPFERLVFGGVGGVEYVTRGGELLDQIAWAYYGGHGFLEVLISANSGAETLPAVLPPQVRIVLPPRPVSPLTTARLWS